MKPLFMAYLSRSGSTLIAKNMDCFEKISVTPEADIFSFASHIISTQSELNSIVNALYCDQRFFTWGINKSVLEGKFSRINFPLSFNKLHDIIIELFPTEKKDVKYILNKSSVLGNYYNILRIFQDPIIIFVYRDIRAITNSLIKTYNPHTDKSMQENTILLAMHYNRLLKIKRRNRNNDIFIKYEDFIETPDGFLEDKLKMLADKGQFVDAYNNMYTKKLSSKQRILHENLDKPIDKNLATAWEKELDPTYIYILQLIAGNTLKTFGYKSIEIKLNQINKQVLLKEVYEFVFSKKMGLPFLYRSILKKY